MSFTTRSYKNIPEGKADYNSQEIIDKLAELTNSGDFISRTSSISNGITTVTSTWKNFNSFRNYQFWRNISGESSKAEAYRQANGITITYEEHEEWNQP